MFDGIRIMSIWSQLIELKLASGQASHRDSDLDDVQQLIVRRSASARFCRSDGIPVCVTPIYKIWDDAQSARE